MSFRISLCSALTICTLTCAIGVATPAMAKVTKLEITSKDSFCMLAGAYVAFPRTRADADASHDGRKPVLERYKTRNDYVNQVRIAARDLEHDGFLLPDDAAVIIQSSAESPLWRN